MEFKIIVIVISIIPYCDCCNRICDRQTSNCIGILKAPQEHRSFGHSYFQESNHFRHLLAIQIRSTQWCKRQFSQHAPYSNRWMKTFSTLWFYIIPTLFWLFYRRLSIALDFYHFLLILSDPLSPKTVFSLFSTYYQ